MSDVAVIRTHNSLVVPVVGLTLFAIASGFLMSLLPLSLGSFGLPATLAAYLASGFYAGMLTGALFSSRVVGYLGHRHALTLFLGLLLLSVVSLVAWPQSGVWLTSRFVAGLASAGVYVVVESWLLLVDDDRQRAKRLGLYMMALYGASALGQLGIEQFGAVGSLPFMVIVALLVVSMLPSILSGHGTPQLATQENISLSELRYVSRTAVAGCLVSGLLLGPMYGLMPVYIYAQPALAEHTGVLMALVILGGMVVQPVTSYLSPRMSKSLLMALLCGVAMIAVIGVLSANHFWVIANSYLLLGACMFGLYPVAITQACQGQDKERIVSITELMLLCYGIGSVIGPLVAAQMMPFREAGLPYYLGLVLATTGLYMLLAALRATKPISLDVDPPSEGR
ncbi:MAG: MFS transporter [Ferrimonas sp.]